jgi:hypothetical protein
MYLEHYLQWDPHPFLFGSPASVSLHTILVCPQLQLPLESLQRTDSQEPGALTIGCFRLPSDSPASAHTHSESPFSTLSSDFHSAHMSPSAMQEDLPLANADWLFSLEQSIEWMESKNDTCSGHPHVSRPRYWLTYFINPHQVFPTR